MRNKRLLLSVFMILLSIIWISPGYSLEKKTHEVINEKIAQRTINGFLLNDYLINNLGFRKGVEEVLTGVDALGINISNSVFWWLGYCGLPINAEYLSTDKSEKPF